MAASRPSASRSPRWLWARRIFDLYDEMEAQTDDIMKLLPHTTINGSAPGAELTEWVDHMTPLWSAGFQ